MKKFKILIVILNLFLGGFLIYGGIKKFGCETPSPTKIIEQVKLGQEIAPNIAILILKNYIFGMKQTAYFWEFLGFVELLAGVLLSSQFFGKIGAVVALPITLNIFLFHVFLEPNETSGLVLTTALFITNLVLLARTYTIWKPLLFDSTVFKFKKGVKVSQ